MVKQAFLATVGGRTYATEAAALWKEIEDRYLERHRHYHTLQHLDNMLAELNNVRPMLHDWDTIILALVYHDIIYNPLSKKNEAKSAALARSRVKALGYGAQQTSWCVDHILATQRHLPSHNADTKLFIDADLSVLGATWDVYERYAANVRKEYFLYPDLVYNPGRRKVLQHFLDLPRIYKTPWFYERYERQARENLQREQALLTRM